MARARMFLRGIAAGRAGDTARPDRLHRPTAKMMLPPQRMGTMVVGACMKALLRSRRHAALLAVSATLLCSAPVFAQEGEGRGRIVTIGAGLQAYPEYPGADDLGLFPLPFFSIRRPGDPLPVEAPDEGIGFGILGDERLEIGPALSFQNKRRNRDVGAPVGEVDTTIEVGAFVQSFLSPSLRIRAEGRKGLGGHDGFVGDIGADYVLRSDNTVVTIGPRLRLSDDDFQNAYFGVSPAAAVATGLPTFRLDGGIHAVGAVAGITHQLSPSWGIYAYGGYDRLIGDVADSPLVRAFGSRDQFSTGLALTYSFRFDGF